MASISETLLDVDRNAKALEGFQFDPPRPYMNIEGPPYQELYVCNATWTFVIGGSHYFFHADENQETPKTGITEHVPMVPGGDKGMYTRDWLGHASRLFNEHVVDLDSMRPHNELTSAGTYCLADPGREYLVCATRESRSGLAVDLTGAAGKPLTCRFYYPRDGKYEDAYQRVVQRSESFSKPDSDDWMLHQIAVHENVDERANDYTVEADEGG